jgi:hypothetical protein
MTEKLKTFFSRLLRKDREINSMIIKANPVRKPLVFCWIHTGHYNSAVSLPVRQASSRLSNGAKML